MGWIKELKFKSQQEVDHYDPKNKREVALGKNDHQKCKGDVI